MNWLQTLAVVFHVLLAVGIVGIVLLQRGKGADAGAGFGAGASGTVFGARGSASFLSRTTAVLATLFFLTSLGLTYLFSQQQGGHQRRRHRQAGSPGAGDDARADAVPAPGDAGHELACTGHHAGHRHRSCARAAGAAARASAGRQLRRRTN